MLIYGLFEPEPSGLGALRYIGITADLKKRLREHRSDVSQSHKVNWIRSLKKRGLKPEIAILEEVPEEFCDREERWWIAYMRSLGADLTHIREGGVRASGYKHTPERKNKIRIALLGNKNGVGTVWSEERKAASIKLHTGRKRPPETGAKISARLKGRIPWNKNGHISAAQKAKQSATTKGRIMPEWWKEKLRGPRKKGQGKGRRVWNKGLRYSIKKTNGIGTCVLDD